MGELTGVSQTDPTNFKATFDLSAGVAGELGSSVAGVGDDALLGLGEHLFFGAVCIVGNVLLEVGHKRDGRKSRACDPGGTVPANFWMCRCSAAWVPQVKPQTQ